MVLKTVVEKKSQRSLDEPHAGVVEPQLRLKGYDAALLVLSSTPLMSVRFVTPLCSFVLLTRSRCGETEVSGSTLLLLLESDFRGATLLGVVHLLRGRPVR